MKNNLVLQFLKHTVIGGVIFLTPLVLIVLLLGKGIELYNSILMPGIRKLPVPMLAESDHPWVIALVGVIFICFLAGLYSSAKKRHPIRDWFADNVLALIPGFSFLRNMGESVGGLKNEKTSEVIMINLEESWQIGFLIERLDDDLCTVFIPGAPNAISGSVMIVPLSRTHKLDITPLEAIKFSSRLGVNGKLFLSGKIKANLFESAEK